VHLTPSSAWGSSRTHWGSAPSSASSWVCCSLLRCGCARSPRGRDHGCALACSCSHAWRLDWASQCCCLARSPSRPSSSCPTTRHSTRRLRGARGICSILFTRASAVALAEASNDTASVSSNWQVHVPLLLFLPMPSLSTTSSAHWMWRRSSGSARKRRTPDGAERRRTGFGAVSCRVWLPVSREGVAVREGSDIV
jgi:hypothetical protein